MKLSGFMVKARKLLLAEFVSQCKNTLLLAFFELYTVYSFINWLSSVAVEETNQITL